MGKTRDKNLASPTSPPTRQSAREPRWVAWSNDGSKIVARGDTLEGAREAAHAAGEADPIIEPIQPRARLA
jgi:hypothetical protein